MRKILSCLIAFCISVSAWSQLSVGAGGNYTRFLGDYQKSTPGFHTRIQYEKGAYGLGLQYTYHVPFQQLFYTYLDAPSTSPDRTDTKIDFRFQSLDLFIRRSILGNADSKAKLYGGFGASWVFLVYKEKALAAYSGTPIFPLEDGHNRSISVNAMLGSEYRLGNVALYGEAGYSLPTKKRYIKHTVNTITPRLSLQIGVKLPLN
jgi:hypothetical protein